MITFKLYPNEWKIISNSHGVLKVQISEDAFGDTCSESGYYTQEELDKRLEDQYEEQQDEIGTLELALKDAEKKIGELYREVQALEDQLAEKEA